MASTVIRSFENIGHASAARRFPGFAASAESTRWGVEPRGAQRMSIAEGALLRIEGPAQIVALDDRGRDGCAALGIASTLRITSQDAPAPLREWCAARGLSPPFAATALPAGETHLRATQALTVWVLNPVAETALAHGGGAGTLAVSVTEPMDTGPRLPEPLGDIRDEFTIDRGTARAYTLAAGEFVQIIDVHGQQCSDFQALLSQNLDQGREDIIDGTATRSMVRRAYPGPGLLDKFFTGAMEPMLRVVQDTCGRHDTFGLACTSRGYEERGFPGHVNCSDNISGALAPHGVAARPAWPAINFFWNTWIDPHHHGLMTEESYSRPGDYLVMQALKDVVCASTACPDDIDPINGWNPTDIHVRIYRPEAKIQRAVAYREKENAPMRVSEPSPFEARLAPLTDHFAPARDLWAPVTFPATGSLGEYWACREKVTVQDMSGLRKFDIVGPDAETLLQKATTRNVAKLAVHRGQYTLMCDETGAVIDDGTLFRLAPDLFRWCCATEECGRVLDDLARDMGLQVRIHDMRNALPNLSVQGPKSRDVMRALCFTQPTVPSVDHLKWFGVTVARVKDRDGVPFMLSRTGYTGELGYELFCARDHATALWDAVMEAGAPFGITPMGTEALGILRIEAGLAAGGAEFGPGIDAFEAGLGFAVSLKKGDFTGKAALERAAAAPHRKLMGLHFAGPDQPLPGAHVFAGERPVGVVTSATRSPSLGHGIAMARLAVEYAAPGTSLEAGMMDGHMKRLPATVVTTPFVDPDRSRARS